MADNKLELITSIFSFCATWFSAASMQGITGTFYAYGYNTILYSILPWFIGAVLLILLASRLKDYDIITIPEFFYLRYESKVLQAMAGMLIVIAYTLYIIIQVRGFGIVISELLDISYTFARILVYLFIIYTTFGGLFSVSKVHRLCFVLTVAGIFIATAIVLKNVGGITIIYEKATLINTKPFPNFPYVTKQRGLLDPFAKGQMPPVITFTSFFGWGLGLATNPQYATYIISAKDKKTATKMIYYSKFLLVLMYFGLMIIGIGSRVLEPTIKSISSVDEVFPYMINNVIYSPFSGLILIGITAAAVSTANSQLLLAASGFSYDIYKNIINKNISEEKLLNLNRIFIFIISTISLILSINPPDSLLIYGGYIWGLFSSTFLVPLYGGLFWKKASKVGAIVSFFLGLITYIIFIVIKLNFFFHPAFPGTVASALAFYFVNKHSYKREGVNCAN
ncbi:sodium:solute symporter family protein [Schnuerera sp. xch1]|uniref:sodium:solute symporter family protein n=1 Tax=Schnuerera sp. xch1 TaxID=2874283 RepID=UPI0029589E92|nr:sodium:solute symporter family protein [Schnuerera sp. xch1]MBZ2175912.1 sodium:solute symporter family protein [Schnuerera sp. xch1]